MSGDGSSDNGNRTVFRPSPLSSAKSGQGAAPPSALPPPPPPGQPIPPARGPSGFAPVPPPAPGAGFAPLPQAGGFAPTPFAGATPPPQQFTGEAAAFGVNPAGYGLAQPMAGMGQAQLNDDDIPLPNLPRDQRNPLVSEAGAMLALAASVRSGRAQISMPDFHAKATELIAAYDRAIAAIYPEEVRLRARYALCATVDDIAQNLPGLGQDGAEWARRSLVVYFFRENIGGDRFWQLTDELLQHPGMHAELIELFVACLAAGFEGRMRVMPDGRARLQQIIANLYGALEHPRNQSQVVLSPQWQGADAPLVKVSLWNRVALAAAAAALFLLLVYIVLRLLLMAGGSDAWSATSGLAAGQPLRLSRVGTPPPAPVANAQLTTVQKFLQPEIDQKLVVVEEDASTVRVRTTVGQLFKSGSDQLEPGRTELFQRIGKAVETQKGSVTVEGHTDSDKISSLAFPDNMALSKARAETVATIVKATLSDASRVQTAGFGATRPIGSNDSPDGKSLNRRVEIVIPRQQ